VVPGNGVHDMKLKLVLLAAVAMTSLPASAAVLTLDSGWTPDQLSAVPGPTDGSPWTFTITESAHFSLTDAFITGDTFTVSGDINGVSSFFAGPADVRGAGFYGSAWLSGAYSKFTTYIGAGTYSFNITGDGVGGIPAGLALRLDSSVPEPASWAMLIAGFGLVGASMRRRALKLA